MGSGLFLALRRRLGRLDNLRDSKGFGLQKTPISDVPLVIVVISAGTRGVMIGHVKSAWSG